MSGSSTEASQEVWVSSDEEEDGSQGERRGADHHRGGEGEWHQLSTDVGRKYSDVIQDKNEM